MHKGNVKRIGYRGMENSARCSRKKVPTDCRGNGSSNNGSTSAAIFQNKRTACGVIDVEPKQCRCPCTDITGSSDVLVTAVREIHAHAICLSVWQRA